MLTNLNIRDVGTYKVNHTEIKSIVLQLTNNAKRGEHKMLVYKTFEESVDNVYCHE